VKKKDHNGKRSRRKPKPNSPKEPEGKPAVSESRPESAAHGAPESAAPEISVPESADLEFDPGMVEHLRMATSLIEGRTVTREEVLQMLRRVMRQHSFAREKRIDYVLRKLKEKPP
jgi:hypothetical protein